MASQNTVFNNAAFVKRYITTTSSTVACLLLWGTFHSAS